MFEVLANCPLPADVMSLGAEDINQLWREKKIRAVGIKRANALIETAKTSVGVKNGANAARFEMSMLIEDYLLKRNRKQGLAEILKTFVFRFRIVKNC